MVHETETLEPDAERHREHGFFLERYVETYPRIRDLVHDVARHVRRRGTATGAEHDRSRQ
jgi:hypothetical protein